MNSRQILKLILPLFALLILPGCVGRVPTDSSTPAPLVAIASMTVAAMPTQEPTSDHTPRPASTASPPAEATSTLEPTPTHTLRPTMRPTRPRPTSTPRPTIDQPSPTPEPDFAATLVTGYTPRLLATYPSPDGSLEAEVYIYNCANLLPEQAFAYDVLRVVETGSGATQLEVSQFQYCGGLGGFGLAGLFWSPSGRYFYFTEAREGVADGCGFGYSPISRVDTTGWTVANLGGGPLSPDGSRLAMWNGRDLVVYELDSGEIGRVAAANPDLFPGPIAWSPDSLSLAYVQAAAFCIPGQSGETTVARVDLPSMANHILHQSSSPAFQSVTWEEPDILELFDGNGAHWRYDLVSGNLTTVP